MSKCKRLFLDIETSHMTAATFSLFPKFISHDNILEDWHIICAAWKWEGDKEILGELTYTKRDKKVVAALRKAIIEADELVYHNGKKFDYKKLNARVILNDLPPMAKPRETDTLTQCRKHFAFSSNRLDYVAKVLVGDCKLKTGNDLWIKALKGDKKAIDKMYVYCKQDVVLLEKVFNKLRPHIDLGYNPAIDFEYKVCPKCSSPSLIHRGFARTKTGKFQRYQCNNCHGWSQSGTREKTGKTELR